MKISACYEGIKSSGVTIDGGTIRIHSEDDGINLAGEEGDSGFMPMRPGGRPVMAANNNYLYINGGHIFIDSYGDGIDANGSVLMTDGYVVISGSVQADNSAIDYDGTFTIKGSI